MVERKSSFQIVANIFMVLLALCCIFPFALLVMSSLTEEKTLIQNGYSLFPAKFGLDSYAYMFKSGSSIARAYGVTVLVTVAGTVSGMLMTMLLAYPLSRKEFFGRNVLAFIVFFTMLFNGGLVPTYLLYTNYLGIKNTLWALLIPTLLVSAWYLSLIHI